MPSAVGPPLPASPAGMAQLAETLEAGYAGNIGDFASEPKSHSLAHSDVSKQVSGPFPFPVPRPGPLPGPDSPPQPPQGESGHSLTKTQNLSRDHDHTLTRKRAVLRSGQMQFRELDLGRNRRLGSLGVSLTIKTLSSWQSNSGRSGTAKCWLRLCRWRLRRWLPDTRGASCACIMLVAVAKCEACYE